MSAHPPAQGAPMPVKKPKDREPGPEPFEFDADGQTWTLAPPNAGVMRKSRKLIDNPMDLMFTMFENVADEPTLAALDTLTVAQVSEVFGDWMASMGGLGKPSGSSE